MIFIIFFYFNRKKLISELEMIFMRKLKIIIFIQAILIVAILAASISMYTVKDKKGAGYNYSLVSQRLFKGVIKPKSLLIVNYAPLRNKLESYTHRNNLTASVYVENLRTGAYMGINERYGYLPASLNKVPIAILVMKKIEDGELTLNTVVDVDKSLNDTNIRESKLQIRALMEKMLKESDNAAFKTLQNYTDDDDNILVLNYLDYYSDEVVKREGPAENNNGLVTPKSIYNLFSSLYLSTILEPQDSNYILSLMTDTVFDIKKIAKLPANVTVSQKFAIIDKDNKQYFHDCGIIYAGEMRIFYCIMTKDLDEKAAINTIGSIVNNIYYYSINTRETLDYYQDLTSMKDSH